MTKHWDDVREEACQLYSAGRTLKDIEAYFVQHRRFKASTRAWRIKLKAWGVRREDRSSASKAREPHSKECMVSWHPRFNYSWAEELRGIGASDAERLFPLSIRSRPKAMAVLNDVSIPDNESSAPRFGKWLVKPSNDTLSEWYRLLLGAQSYQEARSYLDHYTFGHGQPNILHYAAAKRGPHTVLSYIVTFMMSKDLDLGMLDDNNSLAIEVAVTSHCCSNVNMLLAAHCWKSALARENVYLLHAAIVLASPAEIVRALLRYIEVGTLNEKGEIALELAAQIPNNGNIVQVLLDHHHWLSFRSWDRALSHAIVSKACAETCTALVRAYGLVNATIAHVSKGPPTTFPALAKALLVCEDDAARRNIYDILTGLLRQYRDIDPSSCTAEEVYDAYLTSLEQTSLRDVSTAHSAERCFRWLVRKQIHPREDSRHDELWESSPGCCLMILCALTQLPNRELESVIKEYCCELDFGEELFYLLISACGQSSWPTGAEAIAKCIRMIIVQGTRLDESTDPLCLILKYFPNSMPRQKTEIIQILVQASSFSLVDEMDWSAPLHNLTEIPMPLRLDLAEIILLQGVAKQTWEVESKSIFMFHPLYESASYGTLSYRNGLGIYISRAYELQQCVAHAVSTSVIKYQQQSNGSTICGIGEALRLRSVMKLPAVQILLY